MQTRGFALLAAAFMVAPVVVSAAEVTYDFTATVISTAGSYSSIGDGTGLTGTYTFNLSNAVPGQGYGTVGSASAGWEAQVGYGYSPAPAPGTGAVFSSTLQIAGFPGFNYVSFVPSNSNGGISTVAGEPIFESYAYAAGEETYPTGFGPSGTGSYINIEAPYSSGGLPPALALSNNYVDDIGEIYSGNHVNYVEYRLTSLTPAPVPLPAAVWLFISGLAGIGAFRRSTLTRTRCEPTSA